MIRPSDIRENDLRLISELVNFVDEDDDEGMAIMFGAAYRILELVCGLPVRDDPDDAACALIASLRTR